MVVLEDFMNLPRRIALLSTLALCLGLILITGCKSDPVTDQTPGAKPAPVDRDRSKSK